MEFFELDPVLETESVFSVPGYSYSFRNGSSFRLKTGHLLVVVSYKHAEEDTILKFNLFTYLPSSEYNQPGCTHMT